MSRMIYVALIGGFDSRSMNILTLMVLPLHLAMPCGLASKGSCPPTFPFAGLLVLTLFLLCPRRSRVWHGILCTLVLVWLLPSMQVPRTQLLLPPAIPSAICPLPCGGVIFPPSQPPPPNSGQSCVILF